MRYNHKSQVRPLAFAAVLSTMLMAGCVGMGDSAQRESPTSSPVGCKHEFRVFPNEVADSVVDATSYEEAKGILGLPTNEFGSGIVRNQWVFDN